MAMTQKVERSVLDGKSQATDLLGWYDRHRRSLPWRVLPGETPDPYRIWLSEVMLQQTTVKAVAPYWRAFLERWPTVEALAAAPLDAVLTAWAGLGYYARARNLHKTAQAIAAHHGGVFPRDYEGLRALPGVGDYTAAAVAAIAFDEKATVVDGNVERVVARVFAIETPLRNAKGEIRRIAATLTPDHRPGDFAQAMMDLGATICTPKRPACVICPWSAPCRARALGLAEVLPRRGEKPQRPVRRGAAFLARRSDGAILLRRRPPEGLLGGMAETPTTAWDAAFDESTAAKEAPLPGRWRMLPGSVIHTFTHFRLELSVYAAVFPEGTPAPDGAWWTPQSDLGEQAIPSLIRKVIVHSLGGAPTKKVRSEDAAAGDEKRQENKEGLVAKSGRAKSRVRSTG